MTSCNDVIATITSYYNNALTSTVIELENEKDSTQASIIIEPVNLWPLFWCVVVICISILILFLEIRL